MDGVLYITGSSSRTRAVDAKTGKLLWQYDPKSIEHAGDRLRVMQDASRGLAHWNGKVVIGNGGTEVFAARGCLRALDADTGKYRWHYQTVPGESWDYDSSMDILLADLESGGAKRKALLHAPKNGFSYVIDRKDGNLLSTEKFAKATWASHVDMATGRPVEVPGRRDGCTERLGWQVARSPSGSRARLPDRPSSVRTRLSRRWWWVLPFPRSGEARCPTGRRGEG